MAVLKTAGAAERNKGPVARLLADDGGADHPHRIRLLAAHASSRDLADFVHTLCAVHGRQPGMADAAAARAAQPAAGEWLATAADGFAAERGYLARLAAAAGPLPSTPGQAETEAALVGQRHALEMLARSERAGCAAGAVVALAVEWVAVREVLDLAAVRFGAAVEPGSLPASTSVDALAATTAETRAMAFGAEQVFAQMRGLWNLLEARATARG